MYVESKTDLAPKEEFVVVAALIDTTSEAVESIEIELALKAGHLGLLEVLGHDMVDEFLRLVNNEASSVWLP